jgi:hypothetical protein
LAEAHFGVAKRRACGQRIAKEKFMNKTKAKEMQHDKLPSAMKTPPIVSQEAWEAARQQMLVK